MKRIIFFCHLPHKWDAGQDMISLHDFKAAVIMSQNFTGINAILHTLLPKDRITAQAIAQGCGCQLLGTDYRLSGHDLRPTYFMAELENNCRQMQHQSVVIVANENVIELLTGQHLEHGEFYIKWYDDASPSSYRLNRGSITDFQDVTAKVVSIPQKFAKNMY